MTITVNPNITPTFNQVDAICSGATLAALPTTSINGITGTWSPALNYTATTTYTFTPTAGLCATTATMVITVNAITPAPIGNATQKFCVTEAPTGANLTATGTAVQWYEAPTGGNLLDVTASLSDGQKVYASQTVNGCESNNRLQVDIVINSVPNPVNISSSLKFCLGENRTLSDLKINSQGYELEWYSSQTGTTRYDPDTIIEDGVVYYATLYDSISGCESETRLAIIPEIIACNVKIYNALSLNDDGKNDYMVIENAEYYSNNSLEIYNRNGQLLFQTYNYGQNNSNYFYGKANVSGVISPGSKLPTGSYLYVFKYYDSFIKNEYIVLKGFLTIKSN
jgi:gliding motility-associated-like protein